MKKISILLPCLLLTIFSYAQHPVVHNFDKSTYKAGTQTWCITQDRGGNMFYANIGILQYDANTWELTDTENRTSVRSLLYDATEDKLYFGAANEFGYIYINKDNKREYVNLSKDLGVSMEDIWAMHKLDGDLWLRENGSMYKYDIQSLEQHSFPNKISHSAIIGDRLMIFVNEHGVFELSDNDSFVEVRGTEELRSKRVIAILPHEESIIFVCAEGQIYNLKDGILDEYALELTSQISDATIYCAQTNGDYLALGTVSNGVYIIDLKSPERIHLNTYSGLQNNTVLSMFFDRDNNLWLGLDKGIDLVMLSSPEYTLFGNPDIFGSGYASEIYNGELWLGTNQGLYHASYDKGTSLPSDEKFVSMDQARGQVWDLMTYDHKLFCCHDRGIYIMEGKRCSHIQMNGAWKLERLKDWPDYLLGSSYDRLFLLRKEGRDWKFDCWIGGSEDGTKAFEEDSDGTIWFSHWIKGLFMMELDMTQKSITSTQFMSKNNGFPEDWSNIPIEVNNEIVFTTARGFYGFDKYSDRAYPLERMNSLFTAPPQGTSAFLSSYGYGYFSSNSLQTVIYKDEYGGDIIDSLSLRGLASKRIQGFENIRSLTEDQIMVNTEEGFSIVKLDMLKERTERNLPHVYIKSIDSDTEERLYSSTNSERDSISTLRLPFSSNTLRVKAAYPVYDSNNSLEFSYFLENYDKQWSQFSESSLKEYTRLPHGKYTLRVRARDKIHPEVSETSIEIVIDAPWYYSTTAIIIYIIAIIASGWLLYRIMYRYSLKRARLMSMKKEEKLRKRQMRLDLEHKAQDLAASTMNVIRKNEILLDIDAELERVVENMAEDRNRSLKIVGKIRQQIRENIQHDDVWQKFEKNFDIVYDDFLKRLGERYPQLTMSDKKMCAYLKMELSSKEIAPLLNITIRSVEMTRYRLRKKLGLSREDNLTEFLQKF